MAIELEFLDFIVPIGTIRRKYPGGWERCLSEHGPWLGGRVWHDEYLFRDGAMSPRDIETLVDRWSKLGFETSEIREGGKVWKDVCVVESNFGGPTSPCDWLAFILDGRAAHLVGVEPGPVVGKRHFSGSRRG